MMPAKTKPATESPHGRPFPVGYTPMVLTLKDMDALSYSRIWSPLEERLLREERLDRLERWAYGKGYRRPGDGPLFVTLPTEEDVRRYG